MRLVTPSRVFWATDIFLIWNTAFIAWTVIHALFLEAMSAPFDTNISIDP